MPQPQEVDDLGIPLRKAYSDAWSRITAEQEQLASDPKKFARARKLRAMQKRIEEQLDDLEKISAGWIRNELPKAYALGGAAGAEQTGVADFVWSQIHEEAVEEYLQGLWRDLLKATKGVKDSTRSLVQKVARDEALKALIDGGTAQQAGRRMAEILKADGIHAVRYANGAKHGLAEYAEMAQRTQTAIAYNAGSLNQAEAAGVAYWECFDGPTCGWTYHDDPTLANGMIVDKREALSWPISHPNCRRTFGARPDVTTPKEALKAEKSTTEGQRQAQLAADRNAPGSRGKQNLEEQKRKGLIPKQAPVQSGDPTPLVTAQLETGVSGTESYADFLKRANDYDDPQSFAVPEGTKLNELSLEFLDEPDAWHEVAGLVDSSGYEIKRAWVRQVDGRSYAFEIDPDSLANLDVLKVFDQQITQVQNTLKIMPDAQQAKLRNMSFLRGSNPSDEFYATQFGKPGFKSTATGGDGAISVWGGSQARPSILLHEMGHVVDEGSSLTDAWKNASELDTITSGGGWTNVTKPKSVKGHELAPGSISVTDYGGSSKQEDFAESVRLYFQDRHNGKVGFLPNGTPVRFADMWPERSKFFDEMFDLTSTYESPRVKDLIESASNSGLIHGLVHAGKPLTHDDAILIMGSYGLGKDSVDKAYAVAKSKFNAAAAANATVAAKATAAAKAAKAAADLSAPADAVGAAVAQAPTIIHLTEKQEKLVAALKEWEAQGVVDENTSIFAIIGKTGNIEELKGTKKVDILAAKQYLADEAAKTLALDTLSPLQKAYLQIMQDWKTSGYDATEKSIQSITGKLFKYPEVKGIKKADIEAVHQAVLPGSKVSSTVAGQVTKAKNLSIQSSEWRPGIKTSARQKAAGFLNRSGEDYRKYPNALGRIPDIPSKSGRAKHQLVGELSERLADDEAAWEAMRKSVARDRLGFGNHREASAVTLKPFSQTTRAERYQAFYTENNRAIRQWAGTSGDSNVSAVLMQRAVGEEFQTGGDWLVRSTETQLRQACDREYVHHREWYRTFARTMYQNTQDALAAEGITEISVYRGMKVTASWAQRGGPRVLPLQPANSWSTREATSKIFGDRIFQATIPADRILGCARTGFGCLDEFEYVVLNTNAPSHLGRIGQNTYPLNINEPPPPGA